MPPVVWEWEVVPLRHGKKSLVIDVAANLLVGPQKELVQASPICRGTSRQLADQETQAENAAARTEPRLG